ncbi:MAG TPA: ABC transporter substrate-binding protein [Polyangiaceae bacterium]|nr:ABC transporter substrate-binding protein [Polyangiaceae bacterium]
MLSRRVTQWINAASALIAVATSTSAALLGGAPAGDGRQRPELPGSGASVEPARDAAGRLALVDATGASVAVEPRQRIASGSLLADPVLLALAAPTDIVAFSARAPLARDAYRYAGKPSLDPTRRVAQLLELHPDLVLVNSLGESAWIEQLRAAGVVVFDLGPMWGVDTFVRNVAQIGWLIGRPDAARELASQFRLRLESISRHLGDGPRRPALYLGIHGSDLFGGTRGSSYHDVLTYAGLRDVAAERFQGWPKYDPETLLTLDPEVVVTQRGMRASLCERAELGRLRACGASGDVIEVDAALLNDAGLGMLDAAERVHQLAYPAREGKP